MEITTLQEAVELSYDTTTSTPNQVYRIGSSDDFTGIGRRRTDFFLVENRQTGAGWNQSLADSDMDGVLIWHIQDRLGRGSDLIDLIEGDNAAGSSSYNGDPFPGSTGKTALTDFTSPSSRRWGSGNDPQNPGGNSHVRVFNISSSGTDMTADLGPVWAGTIDEDIIWSSEKRSNVWIPADTVTVWGDLTIPAGVTLTIEEGMVVELSGNRDDLGSGNYTSKAEILVHGDLVADGVIFKSADGHKWGGLVFYGDPQSSVFTNCTIDSASTGVRVEASDWRIADNRFSDCTRGILVESASGTTIQHNLITGSTEYGIGVNGSASTGTTILNTTLHSDVGKGISFTGGAAGTVRNTIAAGFPDGGVVEAGTDSLVTVDYYLGNDTGSDDLSGTLAGTRRALFSDPQFTDAGHGDYTLQSGSPALDLGPEETGLPSEDGTRIDLGRYGGTSQAGKASARLALADYFYQGEVSGWTEVAGTWQGDAWLGAYRVTNVQGPSRAYRSIDASSYTLETRLRGQEGKVFYQQADLSGDFAVHLSASRDSVRLFTQDGTGAAVVHRAHLELESDVWYSVRVEVEEDLVSVSVDDSLLHDRVSTGAPADGMVGLGSYGGALSTPKPAFDYLLALNATPATPDGFVANPLNGRVELCWVAPGDETITGYAYRDSLDGDAWEDWKEISGDAATVGYTVTGLTNDTLYTFQVRAVNDAGAGHTAEGSAMPSATLATNTKPWFGEERTERSVAENSLPGTPVGDAVKAMDKNQADDLSYSLTGSTLFGHSSGQITVSSTAGKNSLSHEVAVLREVTVGVSDGLTAEGTPDTAVDTTIAVAIAVTDVDEPPEPPTDVTVRAAATNGHVALEVTWTASVNYGPPISAYSVEYCQSSSLHACRNFGKWEIEETQSGSVTRNTLTELTPGTEYTVRVQATNPEGTSAPSAEAKGSTAVKPLTVSFGASSYDAQEGGSVSVTVALSEADRVLEIPIAVTAGSGTEPGDYTVSGLTEGKLSFARDAAAETFAIAANRDADAVDETVTVAFGTPLPEGVRAGTPARATVRLVDGLSVPDPPVNLTANPGDTEVTLTWETPGSNGLAITEYASRDSIARGSWTAWTPVEGSGAATTSHLVTGLLNDTLYTFEVRAKNELGYGGAAQAAATPKEVNTPPVISGPASVSFAENGTGTVATYTAADPENHTVTWSVVGIDAEDFLIGRSDGQLSFATVPDYENPVDANTDTIYHVTVKAKDDGTPPDSSLYDVTVTVTDVNEAPVIAGTENPSVAENSTAVATYTATDPENHTITWSLDGGADEGTFSIGGSNGQLRFSIAPDYERPSDANSDRVYKVTVKATDSGSPNKSDTHPVSVTVTNVNEAPVIAGTENPSVAENSTAVATYTASDPENHTITWSLDGGADEGTFSIGGSNGQLRFSRAPDYETPSDANSDRVYKVTVKATDSGSPNKSDTHPVSVTVTNVNEAPVIAGTENPSVAENSTAVATYTATDPENHTITWSLDGGADEGTFSIGGSNGQLRFSIAPDYERPSDANSDRVYKVTVKATDSGSPNKSDTHPVSVTVTDVNEAPDPPENLGASAPSTNGHQQLNVTWTAPDNSGRPALSGYEVGYCETSEVSACDMGYVTWGSATVSDGSATSHTLTGLESFTYYTVRVRAKNPEGTGAWSDRVSARTNAPPYRSPGDSKTLAVDTAPNPFNPSTTIRFTLPEQPESVVSLILYDVTGQVVRRLLQKQALEPGSHTLTWDGRDDQWRAVASGLYLYRLTAGDQVLVRKMTLLR